MNAWRTSIVTGLLACLLTVGGAMANQDQSDPDYEYIQIERRGPVMIATLYNPPQNLMNAPMVAELSNLVDRVADDESVRAIILTGGVEGVFIQHYDVGELNQTATPTSQIPNTGAGEELHVTTRCFLKIEALPKPVIAAINGDALGGGFALALACDWRYLAQGAEVGLPEVQVGVLPGAGGTQRLSRLIGIARALDLIMRGQVVDAKTALEYGMVHRVAPPDKLLDEAMTLANELAGLPPMAVGLIKQTIRQGMQLPLEKAIRLEENNFWRLMRSEDAQRLMREYAESGQEAVF